MSNAELKNPGEEMEANSTPLRPNVKIRAVKRRKQRCQRLRRQQR